MSELLQQIKQLSDAMRGSPRWKRVLDELYVHMRLPMQDVLERVPGEFINDKIAAIGVSRTTYYGWMQERFRPNQFMAAKLAELTGYPAEVIHGQKEEDDDVNFGRASAKKASVVASSCKAASRLHGRNPRRNRRMVGAQDRG